MDLILIFKKKDFFGEKKTLLDTKYVSPVVQKLW